MEDKFARQFMAANEDANVVLVDHRGHGDSARGDAFPPPHTLDACAADADRLMEHLISEGAVRERPRVLVGHSFGGKVALAYRERFGARLTWVLDSPPGVGPLSDKGDSVIRLMRVLRAAMPSGPPPRGELARALQAEHGFSATVAHWMTTNVVTDASGRNSWAFDLDTASALLDDYVRRDMWPAAERGASARSRVLFLRAALNKGWTPELLRPLQASANPFARLVDMPDVGHFLHSEKP